MSVKTLRKDFMAQKYFILSNRPFIVYEGPEDLARLWYANDLVCGYAPVWQTEEQVNKLLAAPPCEVTGDTWVKRVLDDPPPNNWCPTCGVRQELLDQGYSLDLVNELLGPPPAGWQPRPDEGSDSLGRRMLSLIVNNVVVYTFPIPESVTDDQVIALDGELRKCLLTMMTRGVEPEDVEICTTHEL